ncbi:MAG: efflux RND transporter periplasmic adaptor subunit [Verrucomicrobiales bacterium]|nr:efflux RND transporter periplasmic adaptor subunit [Verrucomicrobiales bacterium]
MGLFYRYLSVWGILSATFLLSGCGDTDSGKSVAKPLQPVKVTKAQLREFSDRAEALGTVRALEAINISTNVTDRVAEIFFKDNDLVKEGDLLVRLEDAEEVASVKSAESELAEQEREVTRLNGLVSAGAASKVSLAEYKTRRDVASHKVEMANAQLADRHIKAPFAGALGFRQVSLGALVAPGDLIVTLDILDPVKLDFTVPETFLNELKSGLEITALTEAFPDDEFKGTVTHIDTRVNPVTRSVTVRSELPNPDRKLRPGMLLTTELEKNSKSSVSVPERALVSVQSSHFLFVLTDPEAEKPTVERRQVEIGRRNPGYVEIESGIDEGTVVVTDGLIGLVDGAQVNVTGQFKGPSAPYRPSALGN